MAFNPDNHRTIGLLVLSESIYLMGVIEGEVLPTSVPHKGLQEGVKSEAVYGRGEAGRENHILVGIVPR